MNIHKIWTNNLIQEEVLAFKSAFIEKYRNVSGEAIFF